MDAATGTASWQIASTDEMYFVWFCRASVIVDKMRGGSGCPQSQLSAQCESQGLRGPGRTNTGAGSVFSQS